MSSVCGAKKKDGEKCTVAKVAGKSRCWFHEPTLAKERDAARLKGGEARVAQAGGRAEVRRALARKALPEELVGEVVLDTQPQILKLLALTAKGLLTGQLSPDVSSAVASVCGVALRAQKGGETDDRLKKLEEQTRVLKDLTPETLVEIVRTARAARAGAAAVPH